jgi:peptidoglycan LD-endopeptidase CwlK
MIVQQTKTIEQQILDWTNKCIVGKLKGSASLFPPFKEKLDNVFANMRTKGYSPKVVWGFRTKAEQDDLYYQGRTRGGNIVTYVKYPNSQHCFGIAADVCDSVLGYNVPEKYWVLMANFALQEGLESGYYWDIKDKGHIELKGFSKDFIRGCLIHSQTL